MLLPRVRAYISRHFLLTPGQSLAVGVSGGPDSIALLHLLTRLRADYDLKLTVAHVHHGLRAEADQEAEFVARTASAWDIACQVERVDVAVLAQAERLSIEEAGRRARYEFFARLAPTVAVAHNADDQAETVLMHFLRGSGPAGLRGMVPLSRQVSVAGRRVTVIRPLLGVPRAEIKAYLAAHELDSVNDATNADPTFFRNRLRHELLPFLERYNPNLRDVLGRTAEIMAGDYELLRGLVEEVWRQVVIQDSKESTPRPETITFDYLRWRSLPSAMQRALLREAVQRLRADLRNVDFTPIDQAVRWTETAASDHAIDLLGGLCLTLAGPDLRVGPWRSAISHQHLRSTPSPEGASGQVLSTLTIPGSTQFLKYHFTAAYLDSFSLAEIESNTDPWTAYLDAALAPFRLRVRRPGDRFQPLGLTGTVKISDFMINHKIPLEVREAWPLLVGGPNAETILWVPGHRLAAQAKVRPGTSQVVRVNVTAQSNEA